MWVSARAVVRSGLISDRPVSSSGVGVEGSIWAPMPEPPEAPNARSVPWRAERHAEVLGRVLDAGLQVGSEIALDLVLERIVEAACELTGARYGALGVVDPSVRELVEFVTVGISEEERLRLGELPRGRRDSWCADPGCIAAAVG